MTLDREVILRASVDWRWVPDGAERLELGGIEAIDYPSWARMGFQATPHQVDNPDAAVKAIVDAARARGRNEIDWWISPSATPAVEGILIALGARLDARIDILAADLTKPIATVRNGRVEALLVDNAERLDDFEHVAAAVWGGAPSSGERREQQLAGLPIDAEGSFRVVAYSDDEPITSAGCQLAGEVARLYGGATLPEARGLGGYSATVHKRVEIAVENGARTGLVHARVDTSKPILVRMGFSEFGHARVYKMPVGEPR
jgi:hypothetical protein